MEATTGKVLEFINFEFEDVKEKLVTEFHRDGYGRAEVEELFKMACKRELEGRCACCGKPKVDIA